MRQHATIVFSAIALAAASASVPAPAQAINFGDDASKYARDGECDDKRFSGAGMTDTPLLDSDVGHDATDCRAAYNQGRLTFNGNENSNNNSSGGGNRNDVNRIIWGDDNGKYANDGECDDKRFIGPGMTSTPLLDSDIKHDASDCRAAYRQGRLQLRQ